MEFYQAIIFLSIVFFGVLGNRNWFYGVIIFWVIWTIVMIFAPKLMVIQLLNIAVSSWLALKIIDLRDKKRVEKRIVNESYKIIDKSVDSSRSTKIYNDVYLITTPSWSAGAFDFKRVLEQHDIRIQQTVKMARHAGVLGLSQALNHLSSHLKNGDIVCIVRGGGDTSKPEFDVFRSRESVTAVQELRSRGVVSVVGVGHAHNGFPLDAVVDYSAITPTEAAFFVVKLKSHSRSQ